MRRRGLLGDLSSSLKGFISLQELSAASPFWFLYTLYAALPKWVVCCKPPFGGPEYVLHYLGAYTHRVALSNHRLVSLAGDQVTFRWRDSAHANQQRLMTLWVEEFLRRFLLHTLPRGFVRIRHFGFLAHRRRASLLSLCFRPLQSATGSPQAQPLTPEVSDVPSTPSPTSPWACPQCGSPMIILQRLTAVQIALRSPPLLLPRAS